MKSVLKRLRFKLRRKYWTFLAKRKIQGNKSEIYVNRKSNFTKSTWLGKNVHFNGIYITGSGKCIIGNNFHSGSGCKILTHYHNYESENYIPYDNTYIVKDVIIKDNVWFGIDVIVLPGVIIGEGCVIQAGSVVVKNIPDLAIAGGHPAQVFKFRDSKKYYRLKNENKVF